MDFPACPFCGGSAKDIPELAQPAPEVDRLYSNPAPARRSAGESVKQIEAPPSRTSVAAPKAEAAASAARPATPRPTNGDSAPAAIPSRTPAAESSPVVPARAPSKPVASPVSPRVPAGAALQPSCPLYLGALSLVSVALLPPTLFMEANRVMGVLGFCLASFFAPFAPIAWLAGQTYENRFRSLGIEPANAVRLGRRLGMTGTFLLVAEVVIVGLLIAALRLSGRLPASFMSLG
jgi:hypothetical protein